jgi:hypothetical protein
MSAFIFVPQLDAKDVAGVLRKHSYNLPDNVNQKILSRWHKGYYYDYGRPDMWIPLNSMGGMATKAFHSHGVKFPARIDKELRMLLVDRRIEARTLSTDQRPE